MENHVDINNMTETQKQTLMREVAQRVQQEQAMALIQRASDKCLKKCIDYPGSSLSGSQTTCLSRCTERFVEAFNIVGQNVSRQLQTAAQQGQFQ